MGEQTMAIESNHTMPRDYLFPGTKVWCLIHAGLSHPKVISGEISYLSYNEMGEGRWYYYVKIPKRYSAYVCIDPYIYPPRSRGMQNNWVFLTKEEALTQLVPEERLHRRVQGNSE